MPTEPADIINYWLGSPDPAPDLFAKKQQVWYHASTTTDNAIRDRFGADLARAEAGALESWQETADGALALVILLDQFSRNLYRGSPRVYSNDPQAQAIVREQMNRHADIAFSIPAKVIFYHPLHHAEDLSLQLEAVRLFREMRDTATAPWQELIGNNLRFIESHCDIIAKFGRFPHRNRILGRTSTESERRYLDRDNRNYGQQ